MSIDKSYYQTPLGEMLGAAEGGAVVGLWFVEEQRFLPEERDGWRLRPDAPVLRRLGRWLDAYFAGQNPAIGFPLDARGSEFRRAVWAHLRAIPYGQTATYGGIAAAIGAEQRRCRPPAAQAVGGAVGHNPIGIVIPCHRVVGADGSLTGYGGGLWRKTALLELEGARR
ncbi:MAG: methylated-DNA--[protein]-cysteine S-methyltransferase [Candidatus Accumulibacter sp.]|nr:methylated-DNA--[protein]-cysteine S-methyltransferase [Accumulibacter sp.]